MLNLKTLVPYYNGVLPHSIRRNHHTIGSIQYVHGTSESRALKIVEHGFIGDVCVSNVTEEAASYAIAAAGRDGSTPVIIVLKVKVGVHGLAKNAFDVRYFKVDKQKNNSDYEIEHVLKLDDPKLQEIKRVQDDMVSQGLKSDGVIILFGLTALIVCFSSYIELEKFLNEMKKQGVKL